MQLNKIIYIGSKKLEINNSQFNSIYRQVQNLYKDATNYSTMTEKLKLLGFESNEKTPYEFQVFSKEKKFVLRLLPPLVEDKSLILKNLQLTSDFYKNGQVFELLDVKQENNHRLLLGGYALYSQINSNKQAFDPKLVGFDALKILENKLYSLLKNENLFSNHLLDSNRWSVAHGAIFTEAFLGMQRVRDEDKEYLRDDIKDLFTVLRGKI